LVFSFELFPFDRRYVSCVGWFAVCLEFLLGKGPAVVIADVFEADSFWDFLLLLWWGVVAVMVCVRLEVVLVRVGMHFCCMGFGLGRV